MMTTHVLNWLLGQSLHTLLAFIQVNLELPGELLGGIYMQVVMHTWMHTHTKTGCTGGFVLSICAHQSAILCVDVKQGGREIGRSSLVAGKWGDLFFGSFPVKFPGDQDTENIYLYTSYVLHKIDGEPEREREQKRGST